MSTAKSLAALHLNGKRKAGTLTAGNRFKSSTSNLSAFSNSNSSKSRLQSTSMTNLIAGGDSNNNNSDNQTPTSRIQRPASRNALDSIHNGMNAKYAQVQSKVYLQNIRPQPHVASLVNSAQQKTKVASKENRRALGGRLTPSAAGATAVPNERSAQLIKLKALQENLERLEEEKEQLKQELEREKNDKVEQIQLMKQELQEKLAEHDKQNEEYHQKLLEAYELADQNRRAADSVLSESRQREEDSRKKIDELESQLSELKEFVTMKEEMTGKMYELREQIRDERQRYEEQLKSLHQVFENEKISRHEESTLTSVNNSKLHLDHNSNHYFNRLKPSLQSTESINKQFKTNCSKCHSGSSQLHRSEHDIYGSKMSTRMHDTARSAWRASKQFASSVITGGVGLSACRKCNRRQSSSLAAGRGSAKEQPVPLGQEVCRQQANLSGGSGDAQQAELVAAQMKLAGDQDQHTSVIEVQSLQPNSASRLAPSSSSGSDQAQGESLTSGSSRNNEAVDQQSSLIRVENNKLTIVTKFNDSECNNQSPNSVGGLDLAAPSSGSERSRCESSSSGRGTSSDAGSATASQNGDLDESHAVGQNAPLPVCHDPSLNCSDKEAVGTTMAKASETKRHKRKSSLFKASKVFGGSQASLNKLKSFFTGSSGKVSLANGTALKDGRQQSAEGQRDHLESSRLRCLELQSQDEARAASIDEANRAPDSRGQEPDQVGQGESDKQCGESGATFETTMRAGDDTQNDQTQQQQMDLMEKVRQVGENYELNKYKALNKTVELDARLANDRLLATKLRLSQVCSLNDKLSKQVRLVQQQYSAQEKKLLLTETMLRQLIDSRSEAASRHHKAGSSKQTGGRLSRLRSRTSKNNTPNQQSAATASPDGTGKLDRGAAAGASSQGRAASGADQNGATGGAYLADGALGEPTATAERRTIVSSSGTQTQRSRAKTIISDLRQRLNFVGSKAKGLRDNGAAAPSVSQSDMAIQTAAFEELDGGDQQQEDYDEDFADGRHRQLDDLQHEHLQQLLAAAGDLRRRSISLNDILGSSFVHESASGERIIISRGWPTTAHRRRSSRRKSRSLSARRRVSLTVRRPSASNVGLHTISGKQNLTVATGGTGSRRLNEEQKRRLLVDYLRTVPNAELDEQQQQQFVLSSELDVDSALKIHRNSISRPRRQSVTILKTSARRHSNGKLAQLRPSKQVLRGADGNLAVEGLGRKAAGKAAVVQYDLPVHSSGPIALSAQLD